MKSMEGLKIVFIFITIIFAVVMGFFSFSRTDLSISEARVIYNIAGMILIPSLYLIFKLVGKVVGENGKKQSLKKKK